MIVGLGTAALGLAAAIQSLPAPVYAQSAPRTRQAPIFEVEPGWLKLPNNWVVGVVSAVDVDKDDNVWILHRPLDVPEGQKDRVAPPVLQFDSTGKFLQAWGGPNSEYVWPRREHALYVDDKDYVWIAGTWRPPGGPGSGRLDEDDTVLKLTKTGKLVMQIGVPGASRGATDTRNTYGAADLFVYPKTNELIVADEGNLRVMVLDADTGAFKRMWAAFGNAPVDPPRGGGPAPEPANAAPAKPRVLDTTGPGPPQWGNTHGARVSNDGLVYVADRANRRVQVFTLDGKYVNQVFINRAGPGEVSASGLEFSADPDQRFLYVSDFGNEHLVIVERKSLEVLYQLGKKGTAPGDFQGIHYLAVDSKGNLYVTEVAPGNRLQKFLFKGLSAPPTQ
jgi:hypothetical protein